MFGWLARHVLVLLFISKKMRRKKRLMKWTESKYERENKCEMIGIFRTFGKNRIKVTWARPRTKNRSQRYDPNMRCFKCGIRGHFR